MSKLIRYVAPIVLICSLAENVRAEGQRYGSFVFYPEIPSTLFFTKPIQAEDSFELRKALRNHDIKNIVLASPGGLVFEGLQMAGIIFDKELRTYVPRGTKCASACSFMFFAGFQKLADGDLGVHQMSVSDRGEKVAIGQTQYQTQFTVSEIIGFLNEFGTPAFVYERMFEDLEMYWFNPVELLELNSPTFEMEDDLKRQITKYVITELQTDAKKKSEDAAQKLSKVELIAIVQEKLNRIGCNAGVADGVWGKKTEKAALRFAKLANLSTNQSDLLTDEFIKKLAEAPVGFCPKKLSAKIAPAKKFPDNTFFGYKYWRGNCYKRTIFQPRCPQATSTTKIAIEVSVDKYCPDFANYKSLKGVGVQTSDDRSVKVCYYEK